ncbi:MAG: glycosyltransferase [Archangium sp.]|nr:glycosyltransferase [Archangium sp.]
MTQTLILSPGSWPSSVSVEDTFMQPEVDGALKVFDRVIVAPQMIGGELARAPRGIEIDVSLAERLARRTRVQTVRAALEGPLPLNELFRRPQVLRHKKAMVEFVAHAARASIARHWLDDSLSAMRLDPAHVTVSTFWWTPATTGFALLRRTRPGLKVFTRAHGFDLYEDRHDPAYIPARETGLRWLCRVFPDSAAGTSYLQKAVPWAAQVVETARLGVDDPRVIAKPSTDGVLRVVTCCMLRPIKRIGLLVEGLAAAAKLAPAQRIEWTHHGTGPLQAELEARAKELPTTITSRFAGYSSQAALFEAYAKSPVDVVVNTSVSEGTSVALMEAIACGIPLLVTAVGGNVEIGGPENSVHLSANPSPEEIGRALLQFRPEASGALARRTASRALWERDYDSRRNSFEHFRTLRAWPTPPSMMKPA